VRSLVTILLSVLLAIASLAGAGSVANSSVNGGSPSAIVSPASVNGGSPS
jgi:hypothetical protein